MSPSQRKHIIFFSHDPTSRALLITLAVSLVALLAHFKVIVSTPPELTAQATAVLPAIEVMIPLDKGPLHAIWSRVEVLQGVVHTPVLEVKEEGYLLDRVILEPPVVEVLATPVEGDVLDGGVGSAQDVCCKGGKSLLKDLLLDQLCKHLLTMIHPLILPHLLRRQGEMRHLWCIPLIDLHLHLLL